MPDQSVIDDIRARYGRDPRIKRPAQVAVTERAGTVTLRGTVHSPHERRAAVEIARSVGGVRAVEDELSIDPVDFYVDDELRGRALQALMDRDEVPIDHVNVTAANGWLTLTGSVKTQSESNAAFEAVSEVTGAGGITNKIEVVTAGAR